MFNMDEKEVDRSFGLEYKSAFNDMVFYHVRPEQREDFLRKMYKDTNKYASSTVWGAVGDLLQEKFGYSMKDLQDLLTLK